MTIYDHTLPTLWIGFALAVAAAAAGASFLRHLGVAGGSLLLLVLRLGFIGLLGWCLFLPQRQEAQTRQLKPRFVVAVDRSASMTTRFNREVADRWTVAKRVLGEVEASDLPARCHLDIYTFAAALETRTDGDEVGRMRADGPSTSLQDTLHRLGAHYKGQDVAGLLLLSDGMDTREVSDKWAVRQWDWPIYTLNHEPPPAQLPDPEPEIRVESVSTPRRVTVGWTTELRAVVSGQGAKDKAVVAQLFEDARLLQELPVWLPRDGGSKELAFQLEHPETGRFLYSVVVPPLPGEIQTNDNRFAVSVQVVDPKNRVLYIEGPPRWESKFLLRTLQASSQVSPLCFVRGPGGKFLATGQPPGMTPELNDAQLSLVKAVILGDLAGDELGPTRAQAIVKFVESGGSLVLLGGTKAWGAAGFLTGDLARLAPVKKVAGRAVEGRFAVRLTDTGQVHPAFAGDPALWQAVPPVLSIFPSSDLAPGAEALLQADTSQGRQTVVAAHRYGQGKVVAVLTDSLWRWQLDPDENRGRPYQRFWDQLLAWLSPAEQRTDTERIEASVDKEQVYIGDPVRISARLEGGTQDWNEKAAVTCEITTPEKRRVPLAMTRQAVVTPSGRAFPGFGLEFTAEQPGLHTVTVSSEVAGRKLEAVAASFFVKSFTAETVPRPPNAPVLQSLATNSGGAHFTDPEELVRTLGRLEPRGREESSVTRRALWHHAWVLSCLIVLLSAEWALRKFWNMP
jgi:hypothetical protein